MSNLYYPYPDPKRAPNFGRYTSPTTIIRALLSRGVLPTFEVEGVDLSKWNWEMLMDILVPKIDFAILRGGYGTIPDLRFEEYYRELLARLVPIGIYWYVYVGQVDLDAQVEKIANFLEAHQWQLPPVADFETTNLGLYECTMWIEEFMRKLQARVGKRLMIYTSPGWWNGHTLPNSWMKLYYLWVAHWTTLPSPIIPNGFGSALFWQWSADGNREGEAFGTRGGDADMDKNRFMLTRAEFDAMFGIVTPPPPPENSVIFYESLYDGLRFRTGPSVKYPLTGFHINKGNRVVQLDDEVWIQTESGWVAARHDGKDYMKLVP